MTVVLTGHWNVEDNTMLQQLAILFPLFGILAALNIILFMYVYENLWGRKIREDFESIKRSVEIEKYYRPTSRD